MPVPYTVVNKEAPEPIYDLSVITVCCNVLTALKRTTASVLGQKAVFPNISIEHVIVDGASTDGTPEWLAEMKAQGKIETYITEPDRGIYDAMNKGINLARGRVLLFLNADDVFEHVDLKPCLAPILEGKTRTVGATCRAYGKTSYLRAAPNLYKMNISCPVCHQAYFAETALYRELGGYQSETFMCLADTDFMNRAADLIGVPVIVDVMPTAMPLGGFSADCAIHFCDEFILLITRNRERMLNHCRKDSAYCKAIVAVLLNHCIALRRWQLTHTRAIGDRITELQELCMALHGITPSRKAKAAMRFAAGPYLSTIRAKKQCTRFQWFRIRRYRKACDISAANPYASIVRPYRQTFSSTALYYLKKMFSCFLPRRKKDAPAN